MSKRAEVNGICRTERAKSRNRTKKQSKLQASHRSKPKKTRKILGVELKAAKTR